MEADFGILPVPMLDEKQGEYYSGVHAYGLSLIGVPVTCKDTVMTGAVLESMAYESLDTLTPAYYNVTLNGKYFRDEESGEMLDIIFGTRVYDLGYFCDWGGIGAMMQKMSSNKSNSIASDYASRTAVIDGEIKKTIDAFNFFIK